MNQKIGKVVLFLIIALAFILRIYQISSNPPSLNWDEVSLGYNAYSILRTGKDEWGKTFPIIFQAYGDYKLPGYIYTLLPFVSIFGLNEFSVRLPSVLAGTITVYFTYLIVKELLKKHDQQKNSISYPALISAFLVAIEPWSLFLSRPSFEANLGLCFFLIGLYFFLKSLYSIYNIQYTILFFGLSVWTYNSYRIFTPLFILLLIALYKKELLTRMKSKLFTVLCFLFTAFFFLPMFYQLFNGVGQERYKKVAIIDNGAVGQIVNLRNKYNINPLFESIFFNRPTYFIYHFSKNIISHFSPNFLFVEGGSNYQFSIPGFGMLYKVDAIFLIIGILYLIKIRNKNSLLLLGWLILGTVPSSLTHEAPHVLRSITMLPVPMIISTYGFISIMGILIKQKYVIWNFSFGIILRYLLVVMYILFILLNFSGYINTYYTIYRRVYSWSWQYGYKEAVNYISDNYDDYDKIIITKKFGEPHEFVLFYLKWTPMDYISSSNLIRFKQSDWFWVDRFDKFYFVNDWDMPKEEWQPFVLESKKEEIDCRNIRCLLITSPGNVPKTWNKLETIDFLDGKVAFEIYGN